MPLSKYTSDPAIDAEAAQVMRDAFTKVQAALQEQGITTMDSAAGRVARIVIDGERDVANIVKMVLEALLPKA